MPSKRTPPPLWSRTMVQTPGTSKDPDHPGASGVKVIASQFERKHLELPLRRPIDPSLLNRPPLKETVHAVMRAAAAASQPRGKSATVDPVLTSSSRSTVREAARQVVAAGTQVEKNKRVAGPAVLEAIRYAASRGLPVKVAARQVIAAAEMERNRRVVGREVVEAVRYASAMELPVKIAAAYHEEVIAELRKMQLPALTRMPPASTPRSWRTHDGAAESAENQSGQRSVDDARQAPKSSPAALRGPADSGVSGEPEGGSVPPLDGEPEGGSVPRLDGAPSSPSSQADEREDDSAGPSLRGSALGQTADLDNPSPDSSDTPPLSERAWSDVGSGVELSAPLASQGEHDLDTLATRADSGARPAEWTLPPPDPPAGVATPWPPNSGSYHEDHEDEYGASLVPSIIDLITYALEQLTDWDSDDDELFGDGLEIMDMSARTRGMQGGRKPQAVVEHDAFIIEEEDVRAAIQRAEVAQRRVLP